MPGPGEERKYMIGEVAKLTGATVKTVRYYDEIGLLQPAEISAGGYRLYSAQEVWKLELILTLRYLNFRIDEIRKVLTGEFPIQTAIEWQLEALQAEINHLTTIKSIL